MRRLFKCDDIQNAILAPDKELYVLTYRTLFYVIIYRSYKCKKGPGFWHTLFKAAYGNLGCNHDEAI